MDKRHKNNMTKHQRRVAAAAGRKKPKAASIKSRLEAAKTILRRHYSEVYDAGIDDPRFKGMVRVGPRKYSVDDTLRMAAEILEKEETRQRELRSQYGLPAKGNH